jgi:hypothetical protein
MSTQPNNPSSGYAGSSHGNQIQYKPEDFSQAAINHGQRRINSELASGALELAKAMDQLRTAIVNSSGGKKIDFTEVDKTLAVVYKIVRGVADIKPPGCDPS